MPAGQIIHAQLPPRIDTLDDVKAGLAILSARDPVLAGIYRRTGLPDLRRQPAGLPTLMYIVTEQMISLAAAAAIWQRVHDRFSPFAPADLASASEADFRGCGLSGAKIATMRHLGEAISTGGLDLDRLAAMSDEDAIASLKRIRGIGDWTAEVYLLSCLGRTDVWPAGDVALRSAVQNAFGLTARPTAQAVRELAEPWRPLRAVAARLLWAHYRQIRGMPAA